MEEILRWAADHWGGIAIALSLFIDWNPKIKWNPWRTLLKAVGKAINGELQKDLAAFKADTRGDIAELKHMVEDQQGAIDSNEKDRIRWEVLDFANSCRNKRRHSKDEFEHIVALNAKYEKLLEKTGEKNGVFEAEFNYIKELYEERLRKNDFLGIPGDDDDDEEPQDHYRR